MTIDSRAAACGRRGGGSRALWSENDTEDMMLGRRDVASWFLLGCQGPVIPCFWLESPRTWLYRFGSAGGEPSLMKPVFWRQ